jgi:hypothetical protein
MNRRFRVTLRDPDSDAVDSVMVWAPNESEAVAAAQDWIDYTQKRNVEGGEASAEAVGDDREEGDIVLREE